MEEVEKILRLEGFPDTVYKYRGVDEHSLKIITDGEIFFPSARRFNDPFDCAIGYSFDDSLVVQKKWLMSMARRQHPHLNRQERRKFVKDQIANIKAKGPEHLDVVQSVLQEKRYETGIFCVAGNRTDLLMWAHYANYHKGICLGLRRAVLQRETVNQAVTRSRIIHSLKVDYTDQMTHWSLFRPLTRENHRPFMRATLGTKSTHWAYEEEYRLAIWEHFDASIACGPDLVSDVILGCRISAEDEDRVLEAVRSPGVDATVWRATRHPQRFELVFTLEGSESSPR